MRFGATSASCLPNAIKNCLLPPATEKRYYENLYRALTKGEKLLNPPADTETLIDMIDRAGELAAN